MTFDMFLTFLASLYSATVMVLIIAFVFESGMKVLEILEDDEEYF